MAGLESVGIPGPDYLREALTNCSDPLKAIEEFQVDNGILLPSLRPMLPLLDLHGVPRLEFHHTVMEELRGKLVEQVTKLAQSDDVADREKKLRELLVKTFPFVRLKELRPVVMTVLKYLPHIEDKYLKALVADKQLYNECHTEVKQQIWQDSQSLFGDEVYPLLTQYIAEKDTLLFNHENASNLFFGPSPRVRRQGDVVQRLTRMVGRNAKLYDMVVQFLRTLFLRTRNVHYCTLRVELLMSLHDLDVQEITSLDPCHKFAWCLDACIREKNVDIKRSRELQGFLDSVRRGQEQVLGDISMTLCDPYAINFLATSVLRILQHVINNEGMPRDNPVLLLLIRMLALGLQAWSMVDSKVFKEPKLDPQLVTKFLPSLVSLMVDDQVRSLNSKLPPDDRQSAITLIEHSGPPPDTYYAYVLESNVACTLAMYYTLHAARQKDKLALMRVTGALGSPADDAPAFADPFLHSFVALLIPMIDEFTGEDFCTVVFDEFFFTAVQRESVLRHLMKLLWHVYPKLPAARLELLMKALQPIAQNFDSVRGVYEQFATRIESHQPSPSHHPSSSYDSMDTDLISVLSSPSSSN